MKNVKPQIAEAATSAIPVIIAGGMIGVGLWIGAKIMSAVKDKVKK